MTILLFSITIFLTNVIQGITGFAGTVLAMPGVILRYGIDTAKPVLMILTSLSCILIVTRSFRDINVREFVKMAALMFVGVFFGEKLFYLLPTRIILPIYAVFILLIAFKGLLQKKEGRLPEFLNLPLLLCAGIMQGMFVSGGPLLVSYAVKKLEKNQFRATVALIWIPLNVYLLFKQFLSGMLTQHVLHLTLLGCLPLVLGTVIGAFLYKKMNVQTFLKLTYILLIFSGASLFL